MRSRYSAFVLQRIDYLVASTLPAQQARLDRTALQAWSGESQWLGLSVLGREPPGDPFGHASVTFTARWQDSRGIHEHRERSIFVQRSGHWYFIDPGIALTAAARDRRVLAPDALLLLGFGPRLPQAVRELAQGLHTLKVA